MITVEAREPEDPLDLVLDAADERDVGARIGTYQAALQLADRSAAAFNGPYLDMVRARALCGLARDRQVPSTAAEEAAERAIKSSGSYDYACSTLVSLAELHLSRRLAARAKATLDRLPGSCFTSPEFVTWRLHILNLRLYAARLQDDCDDVLRLSWDIVKLITASGEDDDLFMRAPHEAVEALVIMTRHERWRSAAQAVLGELERAVDTADWFGAEGSAAITEALLS